LRRVEFPHQDVKVKHRIGHELGRIF
jgi:hypothetical protein